MQAAKLFLFALLVALAVLQPGCQEPPETADTLLRKVLKAHGGEKNLSRIEGLLFHGHVKSLTEEEQGKVWIISRYPDMLRVVVELTESREDRLYLQGAGWADGGEGFQPATGMALDLMRFQAEHLSLTLRLMEGRYQARLVSDIVEGEPIRMVLTDAEGLETVVTIDPTRLVIRAVEREFEVSGQKLVVGVIYEEYRTVKGVQLPHRMLNFVNGNPVGRVDFSSIQTNPSIPESIFSAPGDRAG